MPSISWRTVNQRTATALKTIIHVPFFGILIPALLWVAGTLAAGIRRFWKRSQRRWRASPCAYRFHLVGQLIFPVGMIFQAIWKNQAWPMVVLAIAAAMFLIGFISRIQPFIQAAIKSQAATWVYRIAHGFFVIFALVIARKIVFDAIKLPAQYFDISVGLVALIAYVPVWLLAVSALLFVVVSGLYVYWGIWQCAEAVGNTLLIPFSIRPSWITRAHRKLRKRTSVLYMQIIGSFATLFLIAKIFDGFGYVTEHSSQGIRWFAYFADFQAAGIYPGVSCEGRVRLLDNGVVAVARVVNRDINITKEYFVTNADVSQSCVSADSMHKNQ